MASIQASVWGEDDAFFSRVPGVDEENLAVSRGHSPMNDVFAATASSL